MRVLENAVVRLLKSRPFYGHLLLGLRRERLGGTQPLGITLRNGVPTLALNAEVFAGYSTAEQEALLEHVLKHLLHLHPLRRKERLERAWDVACDLAINPSIPGLPAEALRPERFRLEAGQAAEEYYPALRRPFETGNLEGEGFGNAAREEGEHRAAGSDGEISREGEVATLDDHRLWRDADSTPLRLAEEAVRRVVQDAWRASGGETPGELQALLGSWLSPPPIPWRQVLRQFVATAGRVGRTSTWKREHRRFAHITPGLRKRRRLNLLVGVDVSDSTNQRPLREAFARELLQIGRGRDSRLTVLYAGSRIQRIASFAGNACAHEVYSGGGFTDLRPVFAYAREMTPRPAAVIYLTDGYGEAPETADFPTLWVLTKDGRKPAPWGVELRLGE